MTVEELKERISFATADPQEVEIEVVATVEKLLGRTLEKADPLRVFLKAVEDIILHLRLLVDETGKQNLLIFARDENLDAKGYEFGVERLGESRATTTVEVKLSAPRERTTIIKKGTRINAGDEVNFALDTDVIFVAGETAQTVKASCVESGEQGNGYAAGELNNIVDPQPFLSTITNLTTSDGGADVELDDPYRERIHQAPESFSVAGPAGAYKFFTYQVSSLIVDVGISSPAPCEVTVYPLMKGGELPSDEIIAAVYEKLNTRTIRPLTDLVHVERPQVVSYDIDLRYVISRDDAISAAAIQSKVETAILEYIDWQRAKLGRDINKTELEYRVRSAGAKRVEIIAPTFTVVQENAVAQPNNIKTVYAGLEDE